MGDDVSLNVGDTFDPMAGVTATDNLDGDLTDVVEVIGSLDTSAAGTYVLTYVVEDSRGNQTTATRTITVTSVEESTDEDATDDQGEPDTDPGQQGPADGDDTAVPDDAKEPTAIPAGESVGTAEETVGTFDEDQHGRLADTGAQRALMFLLAGFGSIGVGLAAWFISRRKKSAN